MKNSDQRLFIVVFFFSFMYVHAAYTMTTPESQELMALTQNRTIQQKLSLLQVDIPTQPIKKSASQPIQKQTRSTESPVGMRYSASWPDFSEYRPETPTVDRRNSDPEAKSAHPVEHKEPRTLENFVYTANDATEFVKILHRNPKRLQYFLEKLTPQMLDLLLAVYSSDLLYYCIRDKIILDAIDRAIRHNKFMTSKSGPCTLKIEFPSKPIAAECDFDEPVGDVTILMLLAERGLTGLIQLCLAKKYVASCNTINEKNMTALNYAKKAYEQAKIMQNARGLTPNQIVRFRHEFNRLEGCIEFLSELGALIGEEALPARNTIRRAMSTWTLQRTIQKRVLATSMKKLQIQDKLS